PFFLTNLPLSVFFELLLKSLCTCTTTLYSFDSKERSDGVDSSMSIMIMLWRIQVELQDGLKRSLKLFNMYYKL
ncbi:UDP-glucose 4-epimerase, partial [Bienertia sinuspersici]